MPDKCPWCEHPIEYTPESDDLASRLNLAEERLHGVKGENQRLEARVAELEGALIAIVECDYPTYWGWFHSNDNPREIARAALGVE